MMDDSDERSDALPVLSISNLTFGHEPSYKEVNRVNLKLHAGKSFGILGGNECGKAAACAFNPGQFDTRVG